MIILSGLIAAPACAQSVSQQGTGDGGDLPGTHSSAAASPVVAAPGPPAGTALSKMQDLPYKYWGNSFSLKFHRPSCPFAQAMNPIHVEFFHCRREAIVRGEKPCRYCLPPYWTSVH